MFAVPTFLVGYFIVKFLFQIFSKHHPLEKKIQDYLSHINGYEVWWIRTQKEFWLSLNGIAFEQELAKLFNNLGYMAVPTPATGDGGVDIKLNRNGEKIIVQCKALNKPVGIATVRDLYGTLSHLKYDKAILASVSGFTKGVHEFIQGKPIELMDLPDYLSFQSSLSND